MKLIVRITNFWSLGVVRHQVIITAILTLTFVAPHFSRGQWVQTNGPYTGFIKSFAASDSMLFVGTSTGVFLSNDNGVNWHDANEGLPLRYINTLLFHNTTLYAGTNEGLFHSSNEGMNWSEVSTGLFDANFRHLAANGINIFAATSGGLFRSRDNGISWVNIDSGFLQIDSTLSYPFITSIVVKGNQLFAASYQRGVFLSSDSGTTWKAINSGLTDTNMSSLAINGDTIFAGSLGGGIFLSTDNGELWEPVDAGLTDSNITTLAVHEKRVFAGVYDRLVKSTGLFRLTDTGGTWEEVNTGLTNKNVTIIFSKGKYLFVGTEGGGVFVSTNGGSEWNESNVGLRNNLVNDLIVFDTSIISVGSYGGGIFLSSDNGDTWVDLNSDIPNRNLLAVTIKKDSAGGSRIFTGGNQGKIFVSTINGGPWNTADSGLTDGIIYGLVTSGSKVFVGGESGVFVTNNNGMNWLKSTQSGVYQVWTLELIQGKIFAGRWSQGILFSTNLGESWEDGGLGGGVFSIAGNNKYIFAGTHSGGVFRSSNLGGNWVEINTGMTSSTIYDLAVSESKLFAATDRGVFLSTNDGTTWGPVNSGLKHTVVQAIAVGKTTLYAGTVGGGVWRRPISEMGEPESVRLPSATHAIKVYPNPFIQSTTISFTTVKYGFAQIAVVNPLGYEEILFSGMLHAGEHSFTWDARTAPTGMYLSVVRMDEIVEQLRILLVK